MFGIRSYGSYIPFHRLKKSTIAETFGKTAKGGEKAVAYYDEDSLTMAVSAAQNAFDNQGIDSLDAVYFASTTAPYLEKSCSTQVAAVLDVGQDLVSSDFAGSLRAACDAMICASDNAAAGKRSLVACGDSRMGGADGSNEMLFGDGAAAFVFDSEKVIAQCIAASSVSVEYHDVWRHSGDAIARNWDVRYSNTEHYLPFVGEAVRKALEKASLSPSDFSKIVLYGHEDRYRRECALKLGFTDEQIEASLYDFIGNTGCAAAPIMLCSALDNAKSGDLILYVSYSDGCDAMVFKVTDEIENYKRNTTVQKLIDHKDNSTPYGKYLKWKQWFLTEPQKRPAQERSSLPDYFRNYAKIQTMYGSRCKKCGTAQFPAQRVCVHCQSIDQMEKYRFYGRNAKVRTFTLDGQSLSLDPPNYLVVVDFEGGGKTMAYLVDCNPSDVHVGMSVSMSFRRLFEANGVNTYFWKVVPAFDKEDK